MSFHLHGERGFSAGRELHALGCRGHDEIGTRCQRHDIQRIHALGFAGDNGAVNRGTPGERQHRHARNLVRRGPQSSRGRITEVLRSLVNAGAARAARAADPAQDFKDHRGERDTVRVVVLLDVSGNQPPARVRRGPPPATAFGTPPRNAEPSAAFTPEDIVQRLRAAAASACHWRSWPPSRVTRARVPPQLLAREHAITTAFLRRFLDPPRGNRLNPILVHGKRE